VKSTRRSVCYTSSYSLPHSLIYYLPGTHLQVHDRFELLRTLFGDRLSYWNQLNQGLHVLMPPEVASFACARSHAALKALLKLQASYILYRAV